MDTFKVRYTKGPSEVQLGDDMVFEAGKWREGVSFGVAEELTRADRRAEYGFESDPPIGRDAEDKPSSTVAGNGTGQALPPVDAAPAA